MSFHRARSPSETSEVLVLSWTPNGPSQNNDEIETVALLETSEVYLTVAFMIS